MFNIGDKLNKHNYTNGAIWCNENNARIEVIDGEYVIVAIPESTVEELQAEVRVVRNNLLQETDKYLIIDYPLSTEKKELYIQYRTYLRDYTENNEWYLKNPQTFEEWKQSIKLEIEE